MTLAHSALQNIKGATWLNMHICPGTMLAVALDCCMETNWCCIRGWHNGCARAFLCCIADKRSQQTKQFQKWARVYSRPHYTKEQQTFHITC